MEIEIEVYKGQTIFYDEDSDKFVCEITIEDKAKSTKRQSLKDVRKEVDQFIKMNVDFKPFQCMYVDGYDNQYGGITTIAGIRTDGKLLSTQRVGYSTHLSQKEIALLRTYDQSVFDEIKEARNDFEEARIKLHRIIKDASARLVPVDLSKYEHIINPKESEQ